MLGKGGEYRKQSRRMCSVPTCGTRGTKKVVACNSSSSTADFFYKDSTHFIGIIRWWLSDKKENLLLCVNKLYRSVELKVGKGIRLDAVPNKVFHSFQRCEIPAISLLHPFKVTFLPKGVELPSRTSSFVCCLVFDVDNRCLQRLTDQDYIYEQQVVDQLYKTRIEMHATIQSGGRSQKPINVPTPPSQLKSGSNNVPTATSIPSQAKGRKRERADQASEPVKRERSLKADNCDSAAFRSESILKFEISKITEKGGLVDSEGVEKLVQFMQPNRVEKKFELISRSLFAGVVAATENFDCLSRFVQLKGLPVFDQWLQDVHKGKAVDGSPKDGDKSMEEFLLILLRALDKLPVNLQALQMCNIGKSVNHLRTYKNSEIQKKARSLVDTWKKRVEAEMNVDTKSGTNQTVSWSSRSRHPEASQGGNQQFCGPSDAAIKSFSSAKVTLDKHVQAEMSSKLATSSPEPIKVVPSPASVKDGQPRSVVGSNPDLPSTTARDERSSSSSQSHNSQSCSSDHVKMTGFSGKEDARSSTAGSITVNKVSGGSSRSRRSVNGRPVSDPSESPREMRNSILHRNLASEKLSQSGLTCEKALDLSTIASSNHKPIVKIPNIGRSPAQSTSFGPVEDPTLMHSTSSSPALSEKNDQPDPDFKEKADVKTSDVKTESWQSNDFKDILTGSDEGDGSPDAVPEGYTNGNDDTKLADISKAASHPLGNELKSGKLHDTSLSSMNALIESCVKYSQVSVSMSGGDDGGMNLLASVAAGEMSKSNLPSPNGSSGRASNIQDLSGMGDDHKFSAPDRNDLVREQCQSEDGLHGTLKEEKLISVIPEQAMEKDSCISFKVDSRTAVNLGRKINDRSDKIKDVASIATSPAGKVLTVDESKQLDEKADTKIEAAKLKESILSMADNVDDAASCLEVKREATVGAPSNPLFDFDSENKADVREVCNNGSYTELKPSLEAKTDVGEGCNGPTKVFTSESVEKLNGVKLEDNDIENQVRKQNVGWGTSSALSSVGHGDMMTCEEADESKKSETSATNAAAETLHVTKKPKFDLNEGFSADEAKLGDLMNLENTGYPVSARIVNPLLFPVTSVSSGLPASITVAAAAKGPFVPPVDFLRSKRELGWKGSAATSAFRPAEPRKVLEMPPVVASTPDARLSKYNRPVLDFDLNVADEGILEDVASQSSAQETTSAHTSVHDFPLKKPLIPSLSFSVGLDLDLNQVDTAGDMWQGSASSGCGLEVPFFPAKSSSMGGYPISESKRDFDLNNGPVHDEAAEPSSCNLPSRSNMQSQPFFTGLRASTEETGTLSPWFTAGNAFPPVTIPSVLSDRGDQPFPIVAANGPPRVLGPPTGQIPFAPEFYRGSVLSSSPAVPFPSFQYPVFPFGTGFPLPSASLTGVSTTYTDSISNGRLGFAASNSQLLSGPPPAVTSHFPRPYVSLPDGSNSMSVSNNGKWARQGLDLNTGPGTVEMEARDGLSPLASRQFSTASSLALADEQGRMFQQMAGGVLKRKDHAEDVRYKQPSWQ